MKRLLVLGLIILLFISGCNTSSVVASEQPSSVLSDFADTAQTIVSALNDSNSESSNSQNIFNSHPKPNSSGDSNEFSSNTGSETDSTVPGDTEYYNARTDSIYPSRVYFTPIGTYEKRYYKNLDAKTQEVYRIIDNAVYEMQTGYIDLGSCTYSQVVLAFDAVRHDRPEYYWMPSSYLCDDQDNMDLKLGIGIESKAATKYLCTKSEQVVYDSQIKSALEDLNSNLNSDMSEYEREVAVHEWFVNRVTYDYNVADEYQTYGTSTKNEFAFSSYGALVKNGDTAKAVCEGYSRGLQLALNYVGLECGLINGEYNGGSHMWNVVKISDRWYHVDATSDDTSNQGFHLFLNTSTAFILNTHTIDADFSTIDPNNNNISFNFDLPTCNSMDYNYLTINNQMLSDKAQMNNIVIVALISAANKGKTSCEFGFSADSPYYFTKDDINNIIVLNNCINSANNSLAKDHQISSVSYTSITGWKGFLLIW